MVDLSHIADPNRTIEALAGSDTLFSRLGGLNGDPAAVALAALPPLDLGSLTDLGDVSGSLPVVGDLGALGGVGDTLDLSSLLGSTSLAGGLPADGLGLGGLTNGGLPINGGVASIVDTVTGALDLGKTAPGDSTLDSVAHLLSGGDPAEAITTAVESTVAAVGHVGSGAAMAVGELGSVGDRPIGDTLNAVIDDFHTGIGTIGAANDLGINGTVHGVIKLGETIGLGDIGGDNLLTDVVHLPNGLLSGDLSGTVGDIVDHAGAIVPAVEKLVDGVVSDVEHVLGTLGGDASGNLLGNVAGILQGGDPATNITNAVGNLGNAVGHTADGLLNAVDELTGVLDGNPIDALNGVIDDIHAGIGTNGAANDLGLNGTVHGLIKLGNTVGLGDIGGDNLLTDVVHLPNTLLDGGDPTDALGGVVEHVEAIVPAVEKVVAGVVEDLGALTGGGSLPLPLPTGGADSLVGTLEDTLHSVTNGGLPEPVGSLLGGDHGGLGDLADLGGLGGLTDTIHLGTPEHHGGGLGLGLV